MEQEQQEGQERGAGHVPGGRQDGREAAMRSSAYWTRSRIRLGARAARRHAVGMPTTTIPTVTEDRFAAEVLEADGPVLVDFTAAWCAPCRVMKPVLAELASERDDLRVVQLDVDAEPGTAARYGVLSMPTFI